MKFSQTRNEQKSYHKRMMSLNSFNSKTQTEQLWQAMASIAECEEHLIAFNKLTPCLLYTSDAADEERLV